MCTVTISSRLVLCDFHDSTIVSEPLTDEQLSHSNSESTSQSLLRRVRAHDAQAWKRLVELYTPLVCYWCRRAQLGDEDTADLTQEVFRAVAMGIGNFRSESPNDTFRGWLRTVFRSKLLNLVEAKKRQPDAAGGTEAMQRLQELPFGAHSDNEQADDDERQLIQGLYQQAMSLIQAEFESNTWQAFLQMTVEDKPAKVVAADLGMTAGAVHTARWRVLRRLRQELGDLE